MPEGVLGLSVLPLVQLNCGICRDGLVEFYDLVIQAGTQDVLRQTAADTLSNLQRRHAALVLTDRVVRESDFNHIG